MQFFTWTCNESYWTSDWTLNTDSPLFQYIIIITFKREGEKKRRKIAGKIEASHILLLTTACQTDPNLWATVGPVAQAVGPAAQAIFKCPRTRKTVSAAIRCTGSMRFMFLSICMFLSVCQGRQLAISPTCLHFSLLVWSAWSFTAHGFLDSLLYYTPWNWTSLSCFSLSLFTAFSAAFLCTVPQIPTEFDHLIIPVVMAILICIVVAKLTNLQWIAYYNCSAYSPGARVSGAQSSCKWKLVFKVERKTVKTSNFVSLPFTVSLLLKNIFIIGMQVRHCVKQWSFPLETCIFPDKKPQKLFLVISNL